MNIELLAERIREMAGIDYIDTTATIEMLFDNLIECGFLDNQIKESLIFHWQAAHKEDMEEFFK